MSLILDDPLLGELLLEHIEPKMRECLRRYDSHSDGTRKLVEFTQYFGEDKPGRSRPKYSLSVAFTEAGNSYRFEIYKDGTVRA